MSRPEVLPTGLEIYIFKKKIAINVIKFKKKLK